MLRNDPGWGRNEGRAAIGDLRHANLSPRPFAEILIDLEEDPAARAFVVGMLREAR